MKKTWVLHLIFTLLVLPVYFGAQHLSANVSKTSTNAWLIMSCLFGIPLLYFILWFVLTIWLFKRNSRDNSLESNDKIDDLD
ncbi:hypothetical protein [Viridibacillus arvi]|uniref:hypothetical protein n=1 Tax=Viridibacillus arvi TaxID=263475 RepID=UPI0034CD38CF